MPARADCVPFCESHYGPFLCLGARNGSPPGHSRNERGDDREGGLPGHSERDRQD
jgi:hypothetical protein